MEERHEYRSSEHKHDVVINERERMQVSGVVHLDSFDDEEIIVETELGLLAVRGENLHIKHLDLEKGELFIDFYRASRYFWRPSRYITFFLDVAFSILITALVFLGLLASNWGEVRSCVFAGLLLGLLFYYLFLSRYFLVAGRIFWGTFYYMISLFLFFLAKILLILLTLLKIFFVPFIFFWFALKKIYPKADKKIREFSSYAKLIAKRGRNFFQKRK